MSGIATQLRALAADALAWDGETMRHWDQIRHQVETRKGSDLPRMNFESLVENFAERLVAGADEIARLTAERDRMRAALKLHDKLARQDERSGDSDLWTDQYRQACEATREALSCEQSTDAEEPKGN